MSRLAQCDVYLKLEGLQHTGTVFVPEATAVARVAAIEDFGVEVFKRTSKMKGVTGVAALRSVASSVCSTSEPVPGLHFC